MQACHSLASSDSGLDDADIRKAVDSVVPSQLLGLSGQRLECPNLSLIAHQTRKR